MLFVNFTCLVVHVACVLRCLSIPTCTENRSRNKIELYVKCVSWTFQAFTLVKFIYIN